MKKNQHRIEFLCMTPEKKLETITITVAAKARPDRLASVVKQMRVVLEATTFAVPPLTIESCRDYPLK